MADSGPMLVEVGRDIGPKLAEVGQSWAHVGPSLVNFGPRSSDSAASRCAAHGSAKQGAATRRAGRPQRAQATRHCRRVRGPAKAAASHRSCAMRRSWMAVRGAASSGGAMCQAPRPAWPPSICCATDEDGTCSFSSGAARLAARSGVADRDRRRLKRADAAAPLQKRRRTHMARSFAARLCHSTSRAGLSPRGRSAARTASRRSRHRRCSPASGPDSRCCRASPPCCTSPGPSCTLRGCAPGPA